jgi:hypothetical protein
VSKPKGRQLHPHIETAILGEPPKFQFFLGKPIAKITKAELESPPHLLNRREEMVNRESPPFTKDKYVALC